MINEDNIRNQLINIRKFNDVYSIPWKIFEGKSLEGKCKNLNVIVACSVCQGAGDAIFSMKFAKYLQQWYDCKVMIGTPKLEMFVKLGADPKSLISLIKYDGEPAGDCRRFKKLKMKSEYNIPQFDLVFIAPLQADFGIDRNDVKSLFPYSNRFNTFFMSEYNDNTKKGFDFDTGVGGDRFGMLITDSGKLKKLPTMTSKYVVVYIAEHISNVMGCFFHFIEMIAKKYSKNNQFDVVAPPWISKKLEKYETKLLDILFPYFSNIQIIFKDDIYTNTVTITDNTGSNNKFFRIRCDVLPVPNKDMLSLMKFSESDILLSGDQSVSDVLNFPNKNIFYQIVPWKENLARNLVKEIPQKYLKKRKTSCGTTSAIHMKSNLKKFINRWDFRRLARPKMDAIFLAALHRSNNKILKKFEKTVLNTKSLSYLKELYV